MLLAGPISSQTESRSAKKSQTKFLSIDGQIILYSSLAAPKTTLSIHNANIDFSLFKVSVMIDGQIFSA